MVSLQAIVQALLEAHGASVTEAAARSTLGRQCHIIHVVPNAQRRRGQQVAAWK